MKKLFLILSLFITANIYSQTVNVDTLKSIVDEHQSRFNALDERLATDEADLAKHNKIKISGYMQAQWENYEDKAVFPNNYVSLRRVRIKTTYEAADGVKFVLQPDFAPGNISLKDAYVTLNEHWLQNENLKGAFSLWAGKFNRPNYEVEYSSSQREVPERSRVITTLYPGERAIGAKLEINPPKFPLHIQVALLNGADGLTVKDSTGNTLYATPAYGSPNENKDYDNFKDIMARATYNIKLGSFGGLDLGAHCYLGQLKSNTTQTLKSDYSTVSSIKLGDPLKRTWYGAEFQFFADILGGLSIKGEYITGNNASVGNIGPSTKHTITPNFQNKFAGYYGYLIKNIGKKLQFAFRYDYYDPNTDIKGDQIGVKSYAGGLDAAGKKINSVKSGKGDIAYTTLTFALQYYFDDNIRITAAYGIVQNEKVGKNSTTGVGNLTTAYTRPDGSTGVDDFSKVFDQNVFTLRLQAKF